MFIAPEMNPWIRGGLALISLMGILGCERIEVRERYSEGSVQSEDVFRPWGPRDSLHRIRQQTYFFNGNADFAVEFRRGIRHGLYRDYWHNGQIKTEGRYQRGQRQGTWKYYWNRYQLSSQGQYRDDLKQGRWVEYFENGDLRKRGDYEQGRETGAWEGFNNKGDRLWISSCYAANDTGSYRGFFPNGEIEEQYSCRKGKPHGAYEKRSPAGDVTQTGRYDSIGRKVGSWTYFYPNGQRESLQSFVEGQWHDTVLFWDSLGHLRQSGHFAFGTGTLHTLDTSGSIRESMPFVAGNREGEAMGWNEHGRVISRLLYARDTLQTVLRFHDNGKVSQRGRLNRGKRDSLWVRYHSNGQMAETTPYVEGVLVGEQVFFDSLGRVTQKIRYEHGYPAEGKFKGIPGIGPKIDLN
jgi:uncharacterized protein